MSQLYRAMDNLSTGQRSGSIFKASDLSLQAVRVLAERGIIQPVQTPPLEILEGWQARAEILQQYGIVTIGDLLYAEGAELRADVPKLDQWKDEVFTLIAGPPSVATGCGCKRR